MNKVLITGGAGFIGVALSRCLLRRGFKVRALDLVEPPIEGIEKIKGSILNREDIKKAIGGCDYVVHLAAMLGVRRTEIKKLETLNINIHGTINVLDACIKERVKKIIFASSSEVYGRQEKMPIREDSQLNPSSIYAFTKVVGEQYVQAYYNNHGLQYCILRLFNIYGQGQVAEFVLPRFIKAVMEDKQPVIYGTGQQIRAFCEVEDVVKGISAALLSEKSASEVFNIGNDKEPIKVKNLAHRVISLCGKNIKPKFISLAESDRSPEREITERVPDISKARKNLGFEPKITLEEGILNIIKNGNIQETWFDPLER